MADIRGLKQTVASAYPDCTVGTGISPVHVELPLAGFTASRRNYRRPEVRKHYRGLDTKRNLFCYALKKLSLFFFAFEGNGKALSMVLDAIFRRLCSIFSAFFPSDSLYFADGKILFINPLN